MISTVLFSLLAAASAVPHYYSHHRAPEYGARDASLNNEYFDARRFWQELANEMHTFDEMLNDFHKHFPSSIASEGIEGNEYKITIPLQGFEEKEIVVKAKPGVLMIQAVHRIEESSERTYLSVRNLPSNIDVSGSWTYDKGVLKITFPVTNKPDVVTEATITDSTVAPEHSREEIDSNDNENNQDADVGIRGDRDKEDELLTNIIPNDNRVEATTYAVDVKNDVEFVPVRY